MPSARCGFEPRSRTTRSGSPNTPRVAIGRAEGRHHTLRSRQANDIARLLATRYPGPLYTTEWFMVLGDMNDDPTSRPLTALRKAGLTNALDRIPVLSDRWTYWWRSENSVSQLDAMYLSPALAATTTTGTVPRIERLLGVLAEEREMIVRDNHLASEEPEHALRPEAAAGALVRRASDAWSR